MKKRCQTQPNSRPLAQQSLKVDMGDEGMPIDVRVQCLVWISRPFQNLWIRNLHQRVPLVHRRIRIGNLGIMMLHDLWLRA